VRRDLELRRVVERRLPEVARVEARRGRDVEEEERRDRDVEVRRDAAERVDRLDVRFLALERWDLVSPFSRRILLTVRAATSSARPP
jgi:hypothetical protein